MALGDWATRELFSDRLQHIFTKSECRQLIQTRCMCVHGSCFSFRPAAGVARALFRIWPSKEWTCAASQKIKLCRRRNVTETQIIWNLLAPRVSTLFYDILSSRRQNKIVFAFCQCLSKQAKDLILDIFIEEQRDELWLWASAVSGLINFDIYTAHKMNICLDYLRICPFQFADLAIFDSVQLSFQLRQNKFCKFTNY